MNAEHHSQNGHGSWTNETTVPYPSAVVAEPAASQHEAGLAAEPANLATLLDQAAESLTLLSLEFPQSAAPSRGPGRWLRMLTGVDESLLSRVWEERASYTGLGAIVLGTAIMASLSMADALDQTLGPVWPVLALVALFWGTFVCGIDRWLISRTHGMRSSRWRIFLPRMGLALLFGIIIATPLVLTVFGSEVVSRAGNDQLTAVTTYESQLKACNPLPDPVTGTTAALPAGCAGYTLSVPDPAIGLTQAIAQEKQQRTQLAQTVTADNKTIAGLDLTARKECNGTPGQGLSGVPGVGFNCNRDRHHEDAFIRQSNITQLQGQLTALDAKITGQGADVGAQTQQYTTAITNAIQAKVTAKQNDQGRIGLLNRIDALGELVATNAAIAIATVLLGLFVVMVDCLPVLSKMMSGTTRYDRLVEDRLRTAETIASAAMRVSERQATGRDEIAYRSIESEVRARLEQIDGAARVDKAQRDAELGRQIAKLAAEFRRSGS